MLTSFTRVSSSINANAHHFIKVNCCRTSIFTPSTQGSAQGWQWDSAHTGGSVAGYHVCVRDVAPRKALSEQQRTQATWYPPGKVAPASAVADLQPEQGGTPVKLCQNAIIIITAWTSDNDQSPSLTSSFGRDPEAGRAAHT